MLGHEVSQEPGGVPPRPRAHGRRGRRRRTGPGADATDATCAVAALDRTEPGPRRLRPPLGAAAPDQRDRAATPATPTRPASCSTEPPANDATSSSSQGGIANAGEVTRVGAHVLRPANPHSESIHRFLAALRGAGFDGASVPVGIDADGRERLDFIEGDVALPPYPEWVQRDDALASIAELLRRFHDAARPFDPLGAIVERRDGRSRAAVSIVCHNDVCLENVVFRDGVAVGAPRLRLRRAGSPRLRPRADGSHVRADRRRRRTRPRLGWEPADRPARLRLVADAYGLDARRAGGELLEIVATSIARGGEFVRRRVEAGDPTSSRCGTTWAAGARSIAGAVGGKRHRGTRCRTPRLR